MPFAPAFAGRHWSSREELDWVILDPERRRAVAVEVKWNRSPVKGGPLMNKLEQKARGCAALASCDLSFVVVSRSGFSDRPKNQKGKTFIVLGREKRQANEGQTNEERRK